MSILSAVVDKSGLYHRCPQHKTRKRTTKFANYNEVFESYRKKYIFKRIGDSDLEHLIKGLFAKKQDHVQLRFSKEWEYEIYIKSLIDDMWLWNNLANLNSQCLVVLVDNNRAFLDNSKDKMSALSKNISFCKVEDTSHLVPFEKCNQLANISKEFLLNDKQVK